MVKGKPAVRMGGRARNAKVRSSAPHPWIGPAASKGTIRPAMIAAAAALDPTQLRGTIVISATVLEEVLHQSVCLLRVAHHNRHYGVGARNTFVAQALQAAFAGRASNSAVITVRLDEDANLEESREQIKDDLEVIAAETPGARLEVKPAAIAWPPKSSRQCRHASRA